MLKSNSGVDTNTEPRRGAYRKYAIAHSRRRSFIASEITSSQTSTKPRRKHSKATIFLHWVTVLAIVVSVTAILLREYIEIKPYRILLLDTHRQLGLTVLVGVVLRLAARFWFGLAKPDMPMSLITRLCAGLCHITLYLLLVGLPLLGWAVTNAHNVDLNFFGLGNLPRLVMEDSDLADELTDYHIWASWGLLGVLVLHISAAFIHHYFIKDTVLLAMLPGKQVGHKSPKKNIEK
ncbi:MAG: cytochrome b/b6 domain-containing protein [Methyloglobulus sp.]|nr:cytochrome b [Methyloglobulus sp.]